MFDNVTLGELAVLFVAFQALVKGIDWSWDRFVRPKIQRDNDFTNIEKELKDISVKLDNDNNLLKDHSHRLTNLETKMIDIEEDRIDIHNALRVIVLGQQAVTKSLLEDGNNKEGLNDAEKALAEYLAGKL